MITEWKSSLTDKLVAWDLPIGGEWNVILFNNYQPRNSNIDLLWFHDMDNSPAIITKISREEKILRREYESLLAIHACAPRWTPRPLALEQHRNYWGLWMEGLSGEPLPDEHCSPEMARSLVDTVAAIHGSICAGGVTTRPNRYRRLVEEPLESLARYAEDTYVSSGCAALRARIPAGSISAWRVMPQHGDLFPGNILLHKCEWRIIDWENFGDIDFPFYDLLMLLICLVGGKGESPEAWDRRLLQELPALVKRYAQPLRLDPLQVEVLLPLTLVNWFHSQWSTGREQAVRRTYRMMRHYFEQPDFWRQAFLG